MPRSSVVTPKEFWEAFSTKIQEFMKDNPNWRENLYQKDKEWTTFITKMLIVLGHNLGFTKEEVGNEWYRIDVCYFNWVSYYNWDLEVAIEHENNYNDWFYELVKLAHINCGLKVLISYYDNSIDDKLDQAKVYYNKLKYKRVPENWLFIFGPMDSTRQDFIAYEFDGMEFRKIAHQGVIHKKK